MLEIGGAIAGRRSRCIGNPLSYQRLYLIIAKKDGHTEDIASVRFCSAGLSHRISNYIELKYFNRWICIIKGRAQPFIHHGYYAYITVQVTQDFQPVVGERQLTQQHFDLLLADVTLAQFKALAWRNGRELHAVNTRSGVNAVRVDAIRVDSLFRKSMVSLENLPKVRDPSSISSSVVHWATKTDYYHLYTHMRLRFRCTTRPIVPSNFVLSPKIKKLIKLHSHTHHGYLPPKPASRRQWDSASNWHIRSLFHRLDLA